MANPTLVQSGSASVASAASSLTVGTLSSSSVAVDDIVIAWCAAERNSVTPVGPSGWTQLGTAMTSTNSSTALYWKRLASGDLNATIPFTVSATRRVAGGFVAYRGAADPVISQQAAVNSATTSATATSMTPSVADSTLLTFYSSVSTSTPFARTFGSYTSGWTERVQISGTAAASSNPFTTIVSKDLTGGSGTSQTFSSATISSASEYVEMSIVVAPQATNVSTTATLAATGSTSATGVVGRSTTATLSGTGSVTATANVGVAGSATLAGTGSITASGVVGVRGSATLAGTGSISASGSAAAQGFNGTASLSGTGTTAATGSVGTQAGASLAGVGAITASGEVTVVVVNVNGTASLAGLGTISASGIVHGAPRDITVTATGPYFTEVSATMLGYSKIAVSGPSTDTIEVYGPLGEN
jgi:hypothetical protein